MTLEDAKYFYEHFEPKGANVVERLQEEFNHMREQMDYLCVVATAYANITGLFNDDTNNCDKQGEDGDNQNGNIIPPL